MLADGEGGARWKAVFAEKRGVYDSSDSVDFRGVHYTAAGGNQLLTVLPN